MIEEIVDCSGGEEITLESGIQRKLEAIDRLLARHRAKRVMVFCNKIESCREVENHLKRQDPNGEMFKVSGRSARARLELHLSIMLSANVWKFENHF